MKSTIQGSLTSSIFYTMVSVGSFLIKFVIELLRNPPETEEVEEYHFVDDGHGNDYVETHHVTRYK